MTARPAIGQGIGLRLLVLIVLFSSLVTAVSTLLQLYLDYRHDVRAIESRLDEIERSSLPAIASSLWNVDGAQIRTQLEGLMRLPDMQAIEVREMAAGGVAPLVISVGHRDGGPVIARDLPIVYEVQGAARRIGLLHAEASLVEVYDRLIDKAIVILVAQGVKTFLVSMFTLTIVYLLITRHLRAIAGYAAGFNIREPDPPLVLDRVAPRKGDELELVVTAFNAMRLDLQSAYEQLRGANEELARDIAERERRGREMRRLVGRLTTANRELERFAYVASHDLQEPVRSMGSYAQLIAKRYGDLLDDEGREFLAYMTQGATRINALITDLLTYSAMPERLHEAAPVSLGEACAKAVRNLDVAIRAAGATVEVGPLPELPADPALLTKLFENLIDNAIKFRRPEEAPRVAVAAARRDDGVWQVSVADNGIGMAPTDQDVFEVFRRLHPASVYPGTGIGLPICKRVVELHQGRIWMDSQLGEGTTVHFTLREDVEE